MKFEITYMVGKSERKKNIQAKNLDEAEVIADKKFKNWVDIIIIKTRKKK